MTPNLKKFTFAELKIATRSFGADMVLGKGGFGRVFIGWVNEKTYAPSKLGIGMAVAVKRFSREGLMGFKEWQVNQLPYHSSFVEYVFIFNFVRNGFTTYIHRNIGILNAFIL